VIMTCPVVTGRCRVGARDWVGEAQIVRHAGDVRTREQKVCSSPRWVRRDSGGAVAQSEARSFRGAPVSMSPLTSRAAATASALGR
jgi:hypothetical protein